jgi:hypothetical protein
MERDLNGQMIPDASEVSSRRTALELAALPQDAIAAGAKVHRIEPVDLADHKPIAKWVRKDGMTGQRETWQRQLSGHRAGQQRARNKVEPTTISPNP